MNRDKAIYLSEKIKSALLKIQEEEGVEFQVSNISFSTSQMKMSISTKDTVVDDKANLALSKRYGFTQNIIGMEFTCSNGVFVVESFMTKNRKYPIIGRRKTDGRQFKFPPSNILKYLGGDSQVNRSANLKNLLD
jgi:hypothetical protein